MRRAGRFQSRVVAGLFALAIGLGAEAAPILCLAQAPSLPSTPQNQPGPNPQPLGALLLSNPLAAQSPSGSSTASTSGVPQGVTVPSSQGKSFGTIGRGLPGMTGGPPLAEPMGAQDPSSRYMRPPVIAPLFCDPSVNIPC